MFDKSVSGPCVPLNLPAKVLVTGAAGGIGSAIGAQLHTAGCEVTGVGRASEPPANWRGIWIGADIASETDRQRIKSAAGDGIGGLVFAAGILDGASWETLSEDAAVRVLAVNLLAPFFLTRSLLPQMTQDASIVVIGSIAGMRASPATPLYAASKAGLRNLSSSLALLLQPQGVRVNVLAPGLIDTPLTTQLNMDLARERNLDAESVAADRAAAIPMGRAGTTEEVADACLFLLSAQSTYFTGATLFPTGGALAGSI